MLSWFFKSNYIFIGYSSYFWIYEINQVISSQYVYSLIFYYIKKHINKTKIYFIYKKNMIQPSI
jgi:hypothetical protein